MRIKKKTLFTIITSIIVVLAAGYLYQQKADKQNNYNVIFIAFDGLQAKHLDSYGYPLKTTLNLDKFLEQSYLFTKAVSPAPWTVPSFMSVFTSMHPSEHKLVNKFSGYDEEKKEYIKSNLKNLAPSAVTLAEILKKNGYATAAFTGDAGISAAFGYNQGFDEYFDGEMFGGLATSSPKAIEWLEKNKDKKFFLFLHGYDVHGQYAPPEGFDYRYVEKPYQGEYTGSKAEQAALREEGLAKGQLNLSEQDIKFWRAVYDEKIDRVDEKFGQFMGEVEKMGLKENTLFVVFSDHGTEFYEHKRFDHGHTLYGELLDVLMAIRTPGQKEAKKINSLVSPLDIMPTILKILNIKNPVAKQTKGIDLTPAFQNKDVSRNIFSETDYRLYTHKRSIQTPAGWKLILDMNTLEKELYDLNEDAQEQNNLAEKEPKIAYELEQEIYKHLNEMNANGPYNLGCMPVYNDQCQGIAPGSSSLNKLNVVLINIDTLRADHMGVYGYQKNTTPFLDSLFKKGIVFENAITPAYLTFQTDAAILSGLYPSQNNVTIWDTPINKRLDLLPKILGYYGYKTAAFVSSSLWPYFGFIQQFNDYFLSGELKNIDEAKKKVADWTVQTKQPFFVFWHIYDVHLPFMDPSPEFYSKKYDGVFINTKWKWFISPLADEDVLNIIKEKIGLGNISLVSPPENNKEETMSPMLPVAVNTKLSNGKIVTADDIDYIKASYDSGIKYADEQLKLFFDSIKDKEFFNNTLFVISSEHGEDLTEHNFLFHRDLYDVNVRVPLAFIHPFLKPQTIKEPVSSLDIMPTIIAMINAKVPQNIEGKDLTPLINGQSLNRKIFSERPPFDEYSVRTDKWKFILRNSNKKSENITDQFMKDIVINDIDGGDELYNLLIDPNEQQNLVGQGLEIERELRQEAINFREKMRIARQNNEDIKPLSPGYQIQVYP